MKLSQDTSLIKNILSRYAKSDKLFKVAVSLEVFLPTGSLVVIEILPTSAVEQRRIKLSPGHSSMWTSQTNCTSCIPQQHSALQPSYSFLASPEMQVDDDFTVSNQNSEGLEEMETSL